MPIEISRLKQSVVENIEKIHGISDIAAILKVRPDRLEREFLRAERMGLSEYIKTIKIERMKQMLITTDESCMAICLDLGYREDVGARLFKKRTGSTMREYRLRSQGMNL